ASNGRIKEKHAKGKGWHGLSFGRNPSEMRSVFFLSSFGGEEKAGYHTCVREQFRTLENIQEILPKLEEVTLKSCR
ncbi:MAG: hypothetical protein Q7S00_07590, partial [bacterium]|nr:hypothetical protein [bacterium]